MSDYIFGVIITSIIVLGVPASFFFVPYFYVKFIEKIEEDGFQQKIKNATWLHSKKAEYALVTGTLLLLAASVVFGLRVNYSNLESVYYNYLFMDLTRELAGILFGFFALITAAKMLSQKIELPEAKVFTIGIAVVAIASAALVAKGTVKDLTSSPTGVESYVYEKWEQRTYGKFPSIRTFISLYSGQQFEVTTDVYLNGYDQVNVGDKVRLWYSFNSKNAYLIEKINTE